MTCDGNMASIAAINFNNTDYIASAVCPTTWQDSVNTDRIGEPRQLVCNWWIPFNVIVSRLSQRTGEVRPTTSNDLRDRASLDPIVRDVR